MHNIRHTILSIDIYYLTEDFVMAWTCTCGQENEGKFCIACGSPAPVVEEAAAPAVEAEPAVEAVPAVEAEPAIEPAPAVEAEPVVEEIAEPVVEEITEPVAPLVSDAEVDPDNFKPVEPNHDPIVVPAEPVSQQSVKPDDFKPAPMHPEKVNNSSNSYSSSSAAPAEPGKTQAVIALILSLVGILPCLGISSIVGLILAIVSKKKGYTGGMGTAALIISIVTMVLSFIFTLMMVIFVANNA